MGLDMYLTTKVYLWFDNDKAKQQIKEALGTKWPAETIQSVTIEAGYWRKANAIHKWFVDNVQDGKDDCEAYYVSRENLSKLRQVCKEVLENPSKAPTLLPSQSGFFFGGLEYDEDYLDDLRHTIDVIDQALSPEHATESFYYQSSW